MDKKKAPQKEWRPVEGQPPVRIDTSLILKVELRLLCASIADLAERLMADPKHRAEFEAWQAEREKVKSQSPHKAPW